MGTPSDATGRFWRAAALVAVVLVLPGAALAHEGGRAVPVAVVSVSESGPLEALVDVRLRDADGGEVVRNAVVRGLAVMTRPHTMTTYFDPLPEVSPGRYRGRVKLPMTARWTVELQIGGEAVVAKTVRAGVRIERSALTEAAGSAVAKPAGAARRQTEELPAPVISGTLRFEVTSREATQMAVLWVHGLAAIGWIAGLALLLAAAVGRGVFVPGARMRLGRGFVRRGLPIVWLSAAVVVATGVYNTVRVAPFELAWSPAAFGRLSEVPYGKLYEGILLAKLAMFAVMLVAGLGLVLRARRLWNDDTESEVARGTLSRLGVSGVVFLAAAPAIVGAVVALRYVHILSHVAEAGGAP